VTLEGRVLDREPLTGLQFGYGWDFRTGRLRNGFEIAAFLSGHHVGAARYFILLGRQ
jgi:hypothetical protein